MLGQVTLYVARVSGVGGVAISKPCACCSGLIRKYNIKYVYYTTDGSIEREKGSELHTTHISKCYKYMEKLKKESCKQKGKK
ncbi:Hypothetical protein PACV_453 [Pacmanvirus A23]|uniref:Hypothetical protein n=1 Tax=Pacmanvirus A23 TaxID=1932881 RepID=UPI000A09267B|nr:Hypothetical protein B9W72_gp449 [Pacmanvirus A23]SIP86166.1 Hypothetical protein PACV_453 [Pacmanvirus A23]